MGKTQKKEEKSLPHKPFWASLGVFFLLSFLVMLSSMENSLVGNATVQNIATAKAGSAMTLEIKTIPGVKEATVFFKEAVKNSQISFTEDKNIPFSGIFYVKFKASSPDAEKIERVDFTFKIHELKLRDAKINPKDLRLFVNRNEVPTTQVKKENEYLYYQASASELGAMVLGQTQQKQTALPATTVPSTLPERVNVAVPTSSQEAPSTAQSEPEVSPEALSGKATEQGENNVPEEKNFWKNLKEFFRKIIS